MKIEFPEEPVWEPLKAVVGDRCREFMFMGQVAGKLDAIFLYKHLWIRRYINLDQDGGVFRFTGDGYEPVSLDEAIKRVFS